MGELCPSGVTTYITPRWAAQLDEDHSRERPGQVLLRRVVRQAGAGGAAGFNHAEERVFYA